MKFDITDRSGKVKVEQVDLATVEELVAFCSEHGRVDFVKPGQPIDAPKGPHHKGDNILMVFHNDYD